MTDPKRIALYLRATICEIAGANDAALKGSADIETVAILDRVTVRLREIADAMEAADA